MSSLKQAAKISSPSVISRDPSSTAPAVEECWTTIDGSRMRYLRAGSGPPLLLVHGLMGYSFSWRFAIPVLAQYATVCAPDLLGAGFSDRPTDLDVTLRAQADRLLQFVDQMGWTSFDLLGTSHGGAVAMMLAAVSVERSDPRLHRLILVAPANPYSSRGRWLGHALGSRLGQFLFLNIAARPASFQNMWVKRLFGDKRRIPDDALAGYRAPTQMPGLFESGLCIAKVWNQEMEALRSVLPAIGRYPTLLIWGSEDGAVRTESALPLARHFAHGKLVIMPGVGHLPYEEAQTEFNQLVVEFLTGDRKASPV